MALINNDVAKTRLRWAREQAGSPVGKEIPQRPTTTVERFLLLITIVLLPLQDHIPAVAGFSSMFVIFGVLAGYAVLNRSRVLGEILTRPVFISAYIFLLFSSAVESLSPLAMYSDISRFAQMIAAAVLVASLCRDRMALRACLYGYIGAALWLSVLLFANSYGELRGVAATDFQEATDIRAQVFEDNPVSGNLNSMAFVCAQGGVVALAMVLGSRSFHRRKLHLVMSGFCLLASLLTMSRGAAALTVISCATLLFTCGVKHGKTLILTSLLGAGIFVATPDAIWSRMAFSTEVQQGRMESRARVYTTAIDLLPDYVMTGVGAGNFWKKWGYEKGFASGSMYSFDVLGTHNCLLQVTIYWGLFGLTGLLAIIWQAYRCLPKNSGNDELALGLVGVSVSLLAWTMVTHNFYGKEFALGLGLLVASGYWIWPKGTTDPVLRERTRVPFPTT